MSTRFGYCIFYVPDVAAALGFYRAAFGFETKLLTPEQDYGELATGETTLSFVAHQLAAVNLEQAGGFTPLDPSAAPVGATITVLADDVPAAATAAVGAGARLYVEPVEKPWGQTVAYVIDPMGILVEIATPMAPG